MRQTGFEGTAIRDELHLMPRPMKAKCEMATLATRDNRVFLWEDVYASALEEMPPAVRSCDHSRR